MLRNYQILLFPWGLYNILPQIMEKWNEFLTQQSSEDQLNSFPVLIKWVNRQRSIWEQMAITTGAEGVKRREQSNFGNAEDKVCYGCKKSVT